MSDIYKNQNSNVLASLAKGTSVNNQQAMSTAMRGILELYENVDNIAVDVFTSTTGIAAHASGTQNSGTLLTTQYNLVTTVAVVGASVLLPVAEVGKNVIVRNNTTKPMRIFPQVGSVIQPLAVDAPFVLAPDSTIVFNAISATDWEPDMDGIAYYGISDIIKATYTDGSSVTTQLSLKEFELGQISGAGAEALGATIFELPAGAQVISATYMNVGIFIDGTANTPKIGIGSVTATGAVSTLIGTAAFMDYITQQTAADISGTATEVLLNPTAGVQTGIALNKSTGTKNVSLNIASTWAGDNAGGTVLITGTIVIKWTRMV